MLIIIASPPDFLAVVIADEEGDGEEKHHDCAQDDHQHLLICQPTLRRSEILKYDPPHSIRKKCDAMHSVLTSDSKLYYSVLFLMHTFACQFFWVCS